MMKSQTVNGGTMLQRIKRHRESYLLMLPYLIFFTVFTLAPVVVAVVLSFMEYNISTYKSTSENGTKINTT